jgi:hypothetical protein
VLRLRDRTWLREELVNHRINARAHAEPWCAECDAEEGAPCTDDLGRVRAPHRIRALVRSGALLVVSREAAKRARKLRVIELVARRR